MKGHIRERSPGHWAIVIEVKDAAGERKRRWHSFQGTKREAQVECSRLITEAQSGNAVNPSRATLNEFLDRFERDWIATNTTPRSAERYVGSLKHVRAALGAKKLQALRPTDLAALYADMAKAGLAPRTVKITHAVLHKALGLAKRWGLIKDNPADVERPPAPKKAEIEILQPVQAKRLLERLRGGPLYLIASIGLGTGMRRNEMLGLRWKDVDMDAGRATIEQALEQCGGSIRIKAPKTEAGRRTISLPANLVAELREHRKVQAEQRLSLGMGRDDDATVMQGIDGKPLSPGGVTKAWERALCGCTLHSLRHTHASTLLAGGVDVLTVSRRLGHASPSITLDVYGHLIAGSDDRAAKIMETAFGR
jgi:integrase